MCSNILENGYGKVPKLVIADNNISVTAKAIYTLLCVFKGSNKIANPKRETVMEYLNIGSKNTYYKHLKQLVDSGYIEVKQCVEDNKFCSNNYKIFDEVSIGKKTVDVWSNGFSRVPRKVVQDKNISATSKVIYTFLASYSVSSYPSCSMISSIIGITNSKKLFSCLTELENNSYLYRENINDGKFKTNTYRLIGYDEVNDEEVVEKLNNKIIYLDEVKNQVTEQPREKEKQAEEVDEVVSAERKEIKKRQTVISEQKAFAKSFANAEKTLRKNLRFDELERSASSDHKLKEMYLFFDSSINLMLDTIFSIDEIIRIGNEKVRRDVLSELFFNMNYETMIEVYNNVSLYNGFIRDYKKYTLKSIYNAITSPPKLEVVSS